MEAFDINPPFEQNIADTLESNYMPYAMSVIVSRAIPEIDGFKPAHRKLLYTMYGMKLLSGARTKSANVVGQTMKLNPHGDQAIYETLVRLARGNEALLHPYIDSKGNFGKQYSRDMAYAASRYTEVKLDDICSEIFRDIDKDTVEFGDNYDGTMKEPVLLPTTFPNILVNANQGIAVGMASSICSFNLEEVCNTAIRCILDEDADLLESLKAPDFSTGGEIIYKRSEMAAIYETGRGSFRIRSRYQVDRENNCIEITEIPYTTTIEAIMDEIATLVKDGKIKEIQDMRDEIDLNGLRLTLEVRKNTDTDALMRKLFRLTSLESSFSCNFNILVNGKPRVMGIRGIIQEWLSFRTGCVRRAAAFDKARKEEKLHLLEGLARVLLDIDKAIGIIRRTQKEQHVVPNLMKGFEIDRLQAEYIAEIRLRNLNREYILNRVAETDDLKKQIADLGEICSSEFRIREIIMQQLDGVCKKFGIPRKTGILPFTGDVKEEEKEQLTDDYNLRIFLTAQGYLKKIPLVSLRTSPAQKLKEGDSLLQIEDTRNRADLLLFSDRCCTYKLRLADFPDGKPGALGEYLPNLLGMEPEERILFTVATVDYQGHLLFCFENGKIARIDLNSYSTKTNRKKLANAYADRSPLIRGLRLEGEADLAAGSSIGKVLVFNTASIPLKTTRNSQGVQVLLSRRGSRMTAVKRLEEVKLVNPAYYRTRNLPAVGVNLKNGDSMTRVEQLGLDLGETAPGDGTNQG
ncbi:MAG TPA: topoisomerase IV [Clostridiales bacterium]|nr:topoisomerase IV [Clostridiales bacterium]